MLGEPLLNHMMGFHVATKHWYTKFGKSALSTSIATSCGLNVVKPKQGILGIILCENWQWNKQKMKNEKAPKVHT